jgi:HEAT repeat protein
MEGKAVDAELLKRLPETSGKARQVIIELAALRRIEGAVPAVLSSAEDADPGVRRAAFATLSTLGEPRHSGDLARLLSETKNTDDREAIEASLTAICSRHGAKCLPHVLPLAKNKDAELRVAGLRALATIGGPEALAAVVSAVADAEENVQDEAVGILATWPNNWPEDATVAEPLLALAKTGRKPAYKVQGVRGYLLHLQENKKLSNADKLSAIERLLPILQRAPEKRLAIATLSTIPAAKSLELLSSLAAEPDIAEEASLAIVTVASAKNLDGASKETRQKALRLALEKTKNDATRDKASSTLKAIE